MQKGTKSSQVASTTMHMYNGSRTKRILASEDQVRLLWQWKAEEHSPSDTLSLAPKRRTILQNLAARRSIKTTYEAKSTS